MKKRLLTLLPLLLSLLPSQNPLHAMESTQATETTFEKSVYLPYPNKAICVLDELRQHPRFIASHEELNQLMTETHEMFGLTQHCTEEPQLLHTSFNVSTEQQEEFNLAISQLISGNIASNDQSETTTDQTTIKTGLSWTLRLKNLTHSAADVTLYALQHDMFEPDNSDHLKLLNDGILECIKNQTTNKLLEILTKTKEKHVGDVLLADETAQAAHQQLALAEENDKAIFIQNFAQLNANKQTQCKALIEKLQKEYTSTINQTLEIMNGLNSEYKVNKTEFRAHSYENEKIMSALRQLSSPTTIPATKNILWDEATQNSTKTLGSINLTIEALTNNKSAIKDLSHYLLLDNK